MLHLNMGFSNSGLVRRDYMFVLVIWIMGIAEIQAQCRNWDHVVEWAVYERQVLFSPELDHRREDFTLEECKRECLNMGVNSCKSIEYDAFFKKCLLSQHSKSTVSSDRFQKASSYDYHEWICVDQFNIIRQWEQHPNIIRLRKKRQVVLTTPPNPRTTTNPFDLRRTTRPTLPQRTTTNPFDVIRSTRPTAPPTTTQAIPTTSFTTTSSTTKSTSTTSTSTTQPTTSTVSSTASTLTTTTTTTTTAKPTTTSTTTTIKPTTTTTTTTKPTTQTTTATTTTPTTTSTTTTPKPTTTTPKPTTTTRKNPSPKTNAVSTTTTTTTTKPPPTTTTTLASTPTSATTTTTTPPTTQRPQKAMGARFKIPGDCNETVGNDVMGFKDDMLKNIAAWSKIKNLQRLSTLKITCGSVDVEYIVQPGNEGETTVDEAMENMRGALTGGQFSVTRADGETAQPDAFSFEVFDPEEEEEEKTSTNDFWEFLLNLRGEYYAMIGMGVIILILLTIAICTICCYPQKKKKGKSIDGDGSIPVDGLV